MAEEKKPETAPAPPKPPGPPPPRNPGMVTATIDGREVVVKPGTTVIQAAEGMGIEIPYYCWHKKLSVAANCRMCLVEMSNAPGGKLMPACQMPLAEGVTVKTDTPRVKDQQRATLEFLLLNHPVDCSICDQAGECKLQDYYMAYDAKPSRLDIDKNEKGKRVQLGPNVTLDQERCILCTRCVRFMREVAENPQLGVAQRGTRSFITTFPGKPLDDPYATNVVDICPVGALTATDFRFRGRVWFMSAARSVCTGCARGCNVFLDYMGETTYRYRPRENEAVNEEWMCDHGRTTYKPLNQARVLVPRVGRGVEGQVASREVAVAEAARALSAARQAGGVAVLLSPVASLEDLLAACAVAREGLGAAEVFAGGRPEGAQDDFLKRADENPNRKGLELAAQAFGLAVKPFGDLVAAARAGRIGAVWAVGAEVPDAAGADALAGVPTVVVQAANEGPLAHAATVLLPASPHAEADGTFINFEGRPQRFEAAYFPRGESRPHALLCAALGRALSVQAPWSSTREVFMALAPRCGTALEGFAWDALPSLGRLRGVVPLQAGTVDGRPAGQKERVPAEGSEDARSLAPRTF